MSTVDTENCRIVHVSVSTIIITTITEIDDTRRVPLPGDHLIGLVAKASASRTEDAGFKSHLRLDFSGSSHTSDLKIGTPVASLPTVYR